MFFSKGAPPLLILVKAHFVTLSEARGLDSSLMLRMTERGGLEMIVDGESTNHRKVQITMQ